MADENKNISPNHGKDIEQEKLLQYLNSELPDAEQHELENQMNDDPFMNDAMEGLQQLENKNNIPFLVQDLNKSLKKQLRKKNKRKNKAAFKEQPWIYLSAIILLTLIVIAYLVIRNYYR